MNLDFWTMFNIVGLIFVITGKLIIADDFTTRDWIMVMADERFIALLRNLFGDPEKVAAMFPQDVTS